MAVEPPCHQKACTICTGSKIVNESMQTALRTMSVAMYISSFTARVAIKIKIDPAKGKTIEMFDNRCHCELWPKHNRCQNVFFERSLYCHRNIFNSSNELDGLIG